MIDVYLKAKDAADLFGVLQAAGVVVQSEDGFVVADGHRFALDVIGIIYAPTGKTAVVDGVETPVMAALSGYHANLRVMGEAVAGLNEIEIAVPTNPMRAWA